MPRILAIAVLAALTALIQASSAAVKPDTSELRRGLQAAHRLQVVGRYEDAKELYRRLYEKYPNSEAVVREYGETLLMTKDYGEAEELYLEIRRRGDRPLAYAVQLERIHVLQKRYSIAVEDCLDVLSAEPRRIDWVRGELVRIAGEAEGGVSMVLDVIETRAEGNPGFGAYRMLTVEILAVGGRRDEASALLEEIGGSEGLTSGDFYQLGVQFEALEDNDLAIQAYRLALERQGNVTSISGSAFKLAGLLAGRGRAAESRQVLQNLADRYPNSTVAFRAQLMAATLESEVLGRPDKALALYEGLLEQRKLPIKADEVKAAMGRCLMRMGRLSEAREMYFGLAASGESPNPKAEFMAAEVSFYMGETDSALSLFNSLASEHPDWEFANDALDRAFLLMENSGRSPGGWVSFDPGVDAPDVSGLDPLALYAAAEFLTSIDRPDSALGYLTAIVSAHSESPLVDDAMLSASDLHLTLGNVGEAIAGLASLAKDYPDSRLAPLALEKLGDIWWQERGDGRRALEEYAKGLDRYPNSLIAPRVRDKVARLRREVG
jgi:tetratricopeptide (TPR) repeat protein